MKKRIVRLTLAAGIFAAVSLAPIAQMRVAPLDLEEGHVALGLALRHLANAGIFMQATAHPDDENNALLVMMNRGQGFRTILATATRGNGGQNEIGPEIFEALGVLRTEELASLHRFDGAEQYFTRAVDFGYSFGIDETFEKWGRPEITEDYVRLIRMTRPDVVTALPSTGNSGGQHHMASSVIAHDAVKIAGDPTKYPDQIKAGLRPWQVRKFYETAGGFGGPDTAADANTAVCRVNTGLYDQLLGKTFSEIGTEARSMHKCQGMAQLLALPGPSAASYKLLESTVPPQSNERTLFDGVDTTLAGLAKFAGAKPPKELTEGLTTIAQSVQTAQRAFDTQTDGATLQPLLTGLRALRVLRNQLSAMPLDDTARYEIDFRLRQKEGEFQQAALFADDVHVEALASDGIVVPGQDVNVDVIVANRGAADVTVKSVRFGGFDASAACTMTAFTGGGRGGGGGGRGAAPAAVEMSALRKDQVAHCDPTLRIPANARVTEPYWQRENYGGRYTFDADAPFGLPFRPTPFYVQVTLGLPGGEEVVQGLPVEYRYTGDIFSGEKRTELLVVPALSVRMSSDVAIIPADSVKAAAAKTAVPPRATATAPAAARPVAPAAATNPAGAREIRVTVLNDTVGPLDSVVKLTVPNGWTSTPAQQPVSFARGDEATTVRFTVKPAANAPVGEYHIHATATAGGQSYDRGFQVIEYPHIRRYHIYAPADTDVKVIDVKTTPNLTVGYVMGVGDQMPPAIEQLGAKVDMISPDDLAWGDLSHYDVIVTGVRAYERRADLRANNSRLLDYVKNGGTMIVQYNKFEFNDAQYGPYPAQVSANRVTDENAAVKVLEPENKVFTTPNRITPDVWDNWIQERGLYFIGEKDSRYKDLLEMEDNFPYNMGVKDGSLVEAHYGKGTWMYVGLNFWRQMPQGVDGAYKLFANILSVGKTAAAVTPAIKSR